MSKTCSCSSSNSVLRTAEGGRCSRLGVSVQDPTLFLVERTLNLLGDSGKGDTTPVQGQTLTGLKWPSWSHSPSRGGTSAMRCEGTLVSAQEVSHHGVTWGSWPGHSYPPRVAVGRMERAGAPGCGQSSFLDGPGGAAGREASRVPCCSQLGPRMSPSSRKDLVCFLLGAEGDCSPGGHRPDAALASPQAHVGLFLHL